MFSRVNWQGTHPELMSLKAFQWHDNTAPTWSNLESLCQINQIDQILSLQRMEGNNGLLKTSTVVQLVRTTLII